MSRSHQRAELEAVERESMLDDAVLQIVRDIVLREIGGPVRATSDELAVLADVSRGARAAFGTKCFARGALAWLEREHQRMETGLDAC